MKLTTILLVLGCLGLGGTIWMRASGAPDADDRARTTYYASGQIETRVEYQDGKRAGRAETWHKNGQKRSEGSYVDGRMEGEWNFWNADGTNDATRSGLYRDGVLTNEHGEAALGQSGSRLDEGKAGA